MSNVIPFKKANPLKKCSFCGTPEPKCKHFFTNGKEGSEEKAICDVCMKEAKERLDANP
jgi:hypothetical protein